MARQHNKRATEQKNAAQLTSRIQDVVMSSTCLYPSYHSTRGSSPSPPPPSLAAAIDVSSPLERGRSKLPLGPGSGRGNMFLLVVTTDDAVPWDSGSCTNAVVARHPRRTTDTVAIVAVKTMFAGGVVPVCALSSFSVHSYTVQLSSQMPGENREQRTKQFSIFHRVSIR